MTTTGLLLGASKFLVKNRKLQLVLITAQFAYVTYKMWEEGSRKHEVKRRKLIEKS